MTHLSPETLRRIAAIAITEVATALGIEWSQRYGGTCLCRCFAHDDTHPSMRLYTTDNHYHCYACGAHGDNIGMVMQATHVSWREACEWLMDRFGIIQYDTPPSALRPSRRRLQAVRPAPAAPAAPAGYLDPQLPDRLRGTDNDLCMALVETGILTAEQMRQMADLYCLGTSPEHGVIFWQTDDQGRVHDGKVMMYQADCHRSHLRHPYSFSSYLKSRQALPADWTYSHCLFGLHQLSAYRAADGSWSLPPEQRPIVAIVESEKTAVICSALVRPSGPASGSQDMQAPSVLWMATGGLSMLSARSLAPLRGCRVILYPDTDPDGTTYRLWCERAREASRALALPLMVSDLLERCASAAQKARKIDLADFLSDP